MTALQAALGQYKAVVRRLRELTFSLIAIATFSLVVGFVLGVYNEPIRDTVSDWARRISGVEEFDAAYAAYQKGRYKTAVRRLRPLAERGDARAQSTLGLIYASGNEVPTDAGEAIMWLRLAADQGNAVAQHRLGLMHANGRGVPQDYAEAARWYRLAAEQNFPQAQYELGFLYAFGDGVAQDYVTAHMWLNLAAARFPASDIRTRRSAVANREALESKMTREQILEAQRLAREWKPKEP